MKRKFQIVLGMAGAIAASLLYRFPPERYGFYPPCPFHALTGWNCPGCGSTRAVSAILHGEFTRAFLLNPLLPFFLLVLGVAWLFRKYVERHETIAVLGLSCSLVLSTVARNLLHF